MTDAPYADVLIDPSNVIDNRVEMPLHDNGIFISNAGIDWGDAAITAFESDMIIGSSVVDYRIPNRSVVINLAVFTDEFGNIFSVIKQGLMQKVGMLQREGGVLQRTPGLYADIVSATLAFPDVYGEAGEIETNVVLTLECLPDYYGDEIAAGLELSSVNGVVESVLVDSVANYVPNPTCEYDVAFDFPASWSAAGSPFVTAGGFVYATSEVIGGVGTLPMLEILVGTTASEGAEISLGFMPAGTYDISFIVHTSGVTANQVTSFTTKVGPHSGAITSSTFSGITSTEVTKTMSFTTPGNEEIFLAFTSNTTTHSTAYLFLRDVMVGSSTTYVDGDSAGYQWAGIPGNSQTITPFAVDGDYPARCRIVIDETAGEDRHGMVYGLRSRYYDPADTAQLVYEAENLTLISPAAVESTTGASGGETVQLTPASLDTWTSFLMTDLQIAGALTHQGTYRVMARVSASAGFSIRLAWSVGSLAVPILNDPVDITTGAFYLVDLGVVRLDPTPVGANAWYGVFQAYSTVSGSINLDQIVLVPVDDGAAEMVYVPTTGTPPTVLSDGNYGGTAASATNSQAGSGVNAWSIASQSSAGNFASVSPTSSSVNTQTLELTNFGFSIPSDATILGVVLSVTGEGNHYPIDAGPGDNCVVQLMSAGAVVGVNRSRSSPLGINAAPVVGGETVTYGGSSDLWGESWTYSLINASTFGVAIELYTPSSFSGPSITLSDVTITVYYQVEAGFAIPDDAVLYANRTAELRTEGMYRTYDGNVYGPISTVIGDLPRLPPAGLEARPMQLLVRPSEGEFDAEADAGLDEFTAQVYYRPCWLFPPET